MSHYAPPLAEMRFALEDLAGLDALRAFPAFAEATSELVDAILEEAGRFAADVLAPIDRDGGRYGARRLNGVVSTAPGWKEAYAAFAGAGWNGLVFDPKWGGQGLPWLLNAAVQEMWHASNMAFSLCPLLTQGAVEAIALHGSVEQKELYLPRLVSGDWTGTMCLTEPQAGSDLAAVRTRAVPEDAHYRIRGQKIFITYGEHDMTPNIVHLVLARTPGAPEGVKGISLFIVPKFLPDAAGAPGRRNDVRCVSIEHKLGIHASPTAVLAFGDGDGAVGFLVGEENRGLEYMFTMMNVARLAVGIEGVGVAERAYQRARAYAAERRQGRVPGQAPGQVQSQNGTAIIGHPDVRRMLADIKARIEAMRAVAYACAGAVDRAHGEADAGERRAQQTLADLLTPVVKGWCTEWAVRITSTALQVHGDMGFAEETGAAQHFRDARITPIYEGTTGIQAADLVGRKVLRDKGTAAGALVARMRSLLSELDAVEDAGFAALARQLGRGVDAFEAAVAWLVAAEERDKRLPLGGSGPFLELAGTVLGGYELCRGALRARSRIAAGLGDPAFLGARIEVARFYGASILPEATALGAAVTEGAAVLVDLPDAAI